MTDAFSLIPARLLDAFLSAGMSQPSEVTEQISHLLYLYKLDQLQEAQDRHQAPSPEARRSPIFAADEQALRWRHLVRMAPDEMYTTVADTVFPWLQRRAMEEVPYARHFEDVRFTIRSPALLARTVDLLEEVLAADSSSVADLYDCLLDHMSESPRYGITQTPAHITELMVAMVGPEADDDVCDPACGLGEYLVAAAHGVQPRGTSAGSSAWAGGRLHGFGSSHALLRLSSLRLLLRGLDGAHLRLRPLLAQPGDEGRFSVVVTAPPFGVRLDSDSVAPELLDMVRTRNGDILHLAAVIRLLKAQGRAAVVVPEGLLFGKGAAHAEMRRQLVDEHGLQAVVSLPPGTFKPLAGIRTAVLMFVKGAGAAENVWFYELAAGGGISRDRPTPLLRQDRRGHSRNSLSDLLRRWPLRHTSERNRAPSEQSFCVSRAEIAAVDYVLSLQHYRRRYQMQKAAQEGIRLGDFAEVFTGSVRSSQLAKDPEEVTGAADRRVLTPALLTSELPSVDDLPVRQDERPPRHPLRAGDIVGRDLAGIRHWRLLPAGYDGVQPGQGLIIIRLSQELLPAEYVVAYLATPLAEQQLPKNGTIPRVRASDMVDMWVPRCDGDLSEVRASLALLAEGEQEAAHITDELQRRRMRIFESGTGAARRSRLESAAAISSLTAQNLRRQSEPYRLFQESYPYAIARAVRKFRHASSLAEQHEAAIQCAEALITSLGIISLSLAADRSRQGLPAVGQWRQAVGRGGVSIGHWVAALKAVAEDARQREDPAAGLVEATALRKGGRGLIIDLEKLVSLRNKIRHGAGPRTRAEFENSLAKIEKLLFSGLSGCAFLTGARWVYADRLQWLPAEGRFRVSGLALMGDHPDFTPTSFETAAPLADGHLYLVPSQGGPIALSPFCLLRDCSDCQAPELYYPDRLTNSTALLKSLDRGHELEGDDVFAALQTWQAL
ncbi:N-6 DNA methylase [Streptomyces platensis]|uniref:class I SAM-dependent DNA methyltransferase n=1 Tax=Streptomyces platensis TaxID=58346 RepID=UPI002E275E77|nr:N-6 DNA methylase [Streptomyces platensis]